MSKQNDTVSVLKSFNMENYLNNNILNDIADFSLNGNIKSGYANLDALTNLYQGFYVIGAISSLGKTTFIHQMCDQLAEAGEHIVYFSFEQSILELASKSLSRILAKKNYKSALTSLQIRKNIDGEKIIDAINDYKSIAKNIDIVECDFKATIDDIENYVNNYIKQFNIKPIVVIDYLQVIQSNNPKLSNKDVVDMHVKRLKQLQEENNIIVIVISSLNRQNYLTQIDFESFKESGGIEYTADVCWGLQLEVLHDEIFDKNNMINEKREKIRAAKNAVPRRIELCCLKNRFGISNYSCMFNYFPQHDLFVPDVTSLGIM